MEVDKSRDIHQIISDLCDVIFTDKEFIDKGETSTFIKNLSKSEIITLNNYSSSSLKQEVIFITQKEVLNRVDIKFREAQVVVDPFSFDSGDKFHIFRKDFDEMYVSTVKCKEVPKVFEYIFDCLNDSSNTSRLFDSFYKKRRAEIDKIVSETVKQTTLKQINEVFETKTSEMQQKAQDEMNNISKKVSIKVSETSVIILGMFSAIVLTVVAGLFYSSSVIENVSETNLFRLISIVSLVGLVTYFLVASLFWFVSKFRSEKDSKFLNIPTIIITCILVIIFLASIFIQLKWPDLG